MIEHVSRNPSNSLTPCLLVHIDFLKLISPDLQELRDLATTANFQIMAEILGKRERPDAKYFIGSGKLEEILEFKNKYAPSLVIFNHDLTPAQERNLEEKLTCKVMSRTGLILEIFSQRARTHEGKLQVELAQLEYQATRLVRGWTHLERQRGGIGVRGGPGETQLEIDKRLLRQHIKRIKKDLEKVKSQRQLGRHARKKNNIPTISLVGYTNAGKSTLFNQLTQAEVYAANKLFATLDPVIRKVFVPYFGAAYLVDTVGFIRNLPHGLVEAFHATLEETIEADLLIHVIDLHNPDYFIQREQVLQVLTEINAHEQPILEVMNKIDLLSSIRPQIKYNAEKVPQQVFVSAAKNLGIDLLWQAIAERLGGPIIQKTIILKAHEGQRYAALKALNAIQEEQVNEEGDLLLKIKSTAASIY
jgi:GTP-binding protein HflX